MSTPTQANANVSNLRIAGITYDNLICMELGAACSQDVNKLFEYVSASTLNAATKAQLMSHIKNIVVKETCKEVHQIDFFKLSQMDGETITQYVVYLRDKAVLCLFKIFQLTPMHKYTN